jgi:MazG family protein
MNLHLYKFFDRTQSLLARPYVYLYFCTNSQQYPAPAMEKKLEAFSKLLHIMDELREKCPWDREQTFSSLRILTIEETYELAEAIIDEDFQEIKKELGDILLHIVFYSKMGEEKGLFDIESVINSLCEKLIFRHPHVFGDESLPDQEKVKERWEELKIKERGTSKSVLSGVPKSLPALVKAARIQSKARAVGFDWENPADVWLKVHEELNELKHEIDTDAPAYKIEGEFGDLLFSVINAARLYGIDPEAALEKTNQKFKRRFEYLESQTLMKGIDLKSMSLAEMDVYWNQAKQFEKK